MGRNSYTGGSSIIKIRGKSSKPPSINKNTSPQKSLLKNSKVISRPQVERILRQMSLHKKNNNIEALYKSAITACKSVHLDKKTKKNKKFIDYMFRRFKEVGIDDDILRQKIEDYLKE